MVNKSGDPIAFWQQMVGEMQKSFTAFTRLRPLGTTSRASTDDPATGSGNGQKPMADLMENYFAGMNVPSRGQLTALNERLALIEGELAETRALLNQVLAAAKAPPTPAPAPVVDVRPDLSEIKALLNQVLNAANAPQPAAGPAIEAELREIRAALDSLLKPSVAADAEPVAVEAAPKAVEPAPRPAKSRNKKPGAGGQQIASENPSGS